MDTRCQQLQFKPLKFHKGSGLSGCVPCWDMDGHGGLSATTCTRTLAAKELYAESTARQRIVISFPLSESGTGTSTEDRKHQKTHVQSDANKLTNGTQTIIPDNLQASAFFLFFRKNTKTQTHLGFLRAERKPPKTSKPKHGCTLGPGDSHFSHGSQKKKQRANESSRHFRNKRAFACDPTADALPSCRSAVIQVLPSSRDRSTRTIPRPPPLQANPFTSMSSSSTVLPALGNTIADCTGRSCIDGIFSFAKSVALHTLWLLPRQQLRLRQCLCPSTPPKIDRSEQRLIDSSNRAIEQA